MKQVLAVMTILFFVAFFACSKPGNNDPSNDPPTDSSDINPPEVGPEYIRLLTKVEGSGSPGTLLFEYDNENRLVKISKTFNQAAPIITFLFYKNGKLSTIITKDNFLDDKASAIFYYNSNGACSKVVYKRQKCCLPNDDPFYHTVTDSNDIDSYDTLIYNSSHQLTQLYNKSAIGSWSYDVRFTYNSTNDSIPSHIGETVYHNNGDIYESSGLLVYHNNLTHPALKNMWFMYSTSRTSMIAGASFLVPFPILFDDRGGAGMHKYLCFFPKCVTTYKVSKNGNWSNGLGGFVYNYSADSSIFQGTIPNAWPTVVAKFSFKKVNK